MSPKVLALKLKPASVWILAQLALADKLPTEMQTQTL
jgi:hypothetical protein